MWGFLCSFLVPILGIIVIGFKTSNEDNDDTEPDGFPSYADLPASSSCSSYSSSAMCPAPECMWTCGACAPSCLISDTEYWPLNSLYAGLQQVRSSIEANAFDCQSRCAGTAGCTSFTYYDPSHGIAGRRGKCWLQNASSSMRPQRGRQLPVVSGPPSCATAAADSAQSTNAAPAVSRSPSDIMGCSSNRTLTSQCMTSATYDAVTGEIDQILSQLPPACNATVCPKADFAGCVLRMAGHDFMDFRWNVTNGTYSTPSGGSDGCIDFVEADNAGLEPCLLGSHSFVHGGLSNVGIAAVYHNYCGMVSLADFFVVAAEAVMSHTRRMAFPNLEPGFKVRFKFGRTTRLECSELFGRMPDPEHGCAANREVFLENLLLDWKHTAALMGVHTLGRVHLANSGYHGWWSDPVNSAKFNNNYYVSMLTKSWKPRGVMQECENRVPAPWNALLAKNQWDISGDSLNTIGGENAYLTDSNQMMLNTDLCLLYEDMTAAAAKSTCGCQWAMPNKFMPTFEANGDHPWCGRDRTSLLSGQIDFLVVLAACCPGGDTTCGNPDTPQGPARAHIKDFSENDTYWFETFKDAWNIATEISSPGVLRHLDDCVASVADHPTFNLSRPASIIAANEAAAAAAAAQAQTELNDARAAVTDAMLDRWVVGSVMNSCSFTCANISKRCSVEHFEEHLDEVDSFARVKALFEALMVQRPNSVKNDGFFGDWYAINSLQNVNQYQQMTGLQDARSVGEPVVGGGLTGREQAFWSGNCRDNALGEICSANDYSVNTYWCAQNLSGPYPRTSVQGCQQQKHHNGSGRLEWGVEGQPIYKKRVQGTFKGWYENTTCHREWGGGGSNPDSAFAPIIFYRDDLDQDPVVAGVCGWPNVTLRLNGRRKLPQDYCDRAYFSPRFRRLCPCEDTTIQNPICPPNSTGHTAAACLRNGLTDPDCCASQVEGGCAPGYQYSPGRPCRWRSHFQWISTVCCQNSHTTSTTTNLPFIAEGWYLGPLGELNCSAVCQRSLTYFGIDVKPANQHCNFGPANLSHDDITTIVAAIGPRDFNGTGGFDFSTAEMMTPHCFRNRSSVNSFAPYFRQTAGCCIDSMTCYTKDVGAGAYMCEDPDFRGWHWSWLPNTRRLCKCTLCPPHAVQVGQTCIVTTTTTTTTTAFTTTTVQAPTGYMVRWQGAMCTDAGNQGWRGTHAINRKSRINSAEACADRCNAQAARRGCTSFVYWTSGRFARQCRTYTTCTHFRYQGSTEYAGSLAYTLVT